MVKLYILPDCPYCETVRFSLAYLGVPFEEETIDPADRAPLVDLSGQKEVPVLVDGERVLAETRRILRYVTDELDATLSPIDSVEQGQMGVLVGWGGAVLLPAIKRFRESDPQAAATAHTLLDDELELVDLVLHDRSYLAGNRLTYADIAVYSYLGRIPDGARDEVTGPYVNLREWMLNIADYRQKAMAGLPT